MQLLANQLAPVASTHGFGIEILETASYVLQAFRSKTGVQFFVTADPQSENLAAFLVRASVSEPLSTAFILLAQEWKTLLTYRLLATT